MPQPDRPNVLIITCHDIGRFLGCYGVASSPTPHLDRLATQSVRFNRAFATAPFCSPSRASIFTGRSPHAVGVNGLTHGSFAFDLDPAATHLARYLADAGYICEHFGVCHESHRDPTDLGYHAAHNGEMLADANVAGFRDRLATWVTGDRSWYAHLGFFEPHTPFHRDGATPDDTRGITVPAYLHDNDAARTSMAAFQGAIRKLDDAVGGVLDALDASGQADRTIVLFTTDHGIPYPRAKGTLYDDGLEVALLVRWPGGGWGGGRTEDALLSNIDHVPTLLDTLGLPMPDAVEGRSYRALLDQAPGYTPTPRVFGEITFFNAPMYQPRRSIRSDRHRLILNLTNDPPVALGEWHPGVTVSQALIDRWRPVIGYGAVPPIEFYDNVADPLSLHDLADDPACAGTRDRLAAELLDWMRRTDDPLLSRNTIPAPPCHRVALDALAEHAAAAR